MFISHMESPMRIPVRGIHLNVLDQGSGSPSLVFLHYFGGSAHTWDEVASRLSRSARCIAIDHRGWGESDAPAQGYGIADLAADAQSVIETLQLDDFVLVGHSMGGKVAQWLASRRLRGLRGLVLVAPSPAGSTDVGDAQREALVHAYDTPDSIAFVRDNILTARPLPDALKARVERDSLRGATAARIGWPMVAMREDFSDELGRIDVPVLVICGDCDQVDPVDVVRREVVQRIPGASLRVLPGVGHLSPLEAPAELASEIEAFIAGARA